MKTVPSGRVLVCMNGALERFGTVTVKATTIPERVGRPVRAPSSVAVVPVMVGTAPESAVEPDPVIVTPLAEEVADVDPDLVAVPVTEAVFAEPVFDGEAVVFADPVAVGSMAVERSGRPESDEAAEAAMTRAIATTIDLCRTLILYAISKKGVKERDQAEKRCAKSKFVVAESQDES